MPRLSLPQNYQISAGTLFEDFESGWAVDSGFDTRAFSTEHVKTGTYSTKFTVGATRSNGSMTKTINTVVDIRVSSVWVYVEDVTKIGSTGIVLYLSSTTDLSKYFSASYPNTSLHDGWNKLVFSKEKWVATGGELWTNTMIRLRVRQYADGTNSSVCHYDKWTIQEYARPKIMIDFDDNWLSAFTEGYAYMQPRGLKGNIFVIRDTADQSGYMTTANLHTSYTNGWDLGTHGLYALTTFGTQAEMEADIAYNEAYLSSNSFTRAIKHYAYPIGLYSQTTEDALIARGFKTSRTVQIRSVQADEIDDAFKLTTRSLTNSINLATAKTYIDDAIAYGGTMRLLLHKLVASPSVATEWAISDFQALIDYIYLKQLGGQLDVVTVSEWYNGMTNPRKLVSR